MRINVAHLEPSEEEVNHLVHLVYCVLKLESSIAIGLRDSAVDVTE